jgi:hypothetical protein
VPLLQSGSSWASTSPIAAEFSTMPSSWNASIEAIADAHASTWPEYVSPPAKYLSRTQSAIFLPITIAPSGT